MTFCKVSTIIFADCKNLFLKARLRYPRSQPLHGKNGVPHFGRITNKNAVDLGVCSFFVLFIGGGE